MESSATVTRIHCMPFKTRSSCKLGRIYLARKIRLYVVLVKLAGLNLGQWLTQRGRNFGENFLNGLVSTWRIGADRVILFCLHLHMFDLR